MVLPQVADGQRTPFTIRLTEALARARALQPVETVVTPRERVADWDGVDLYRYGEAAGPPLLMVYSLVNRPFLLDLSAQRSVVARLAAHGLSVYLLDWTAPTPGDRFRGLDDYIEGDIDAAVASVSRFHDGERPHLLGACQGGVLALCYAALHGERLRSLTTLATPADFHTEGDRLARLTRGVDFEAVAAATGNVPGPLLNSAFTGLKPFSLLVRRYLALADVAEDEAALEEFLRLERWMYDSPDQAGTAFVQFVREFYQRNGLCAGTVRIGGKAVDPGRIRLPVFNAYAESDHLVPPPAARALGELLGSDDYSEHALPGGHLGVFIGSQAHRRLYPTLAKWLLAR